MTDLTQVVKDGLANVQEKTDAQLREIRDELADLAQRGGAPSGFGQVARKSAGELVTEDASMQAMMQRKSRAASVPLDGVSLKALVGDAGNTTGNSVYPVQPQRGQEMGNDARRRLSLLDVLPRIVATSGSYEFVSLDGFTNAAAVQAKQGDQKAEQAMAFELKTATISTIAALLPMSEQVVNDSPSLSMFVRDKMTHAALDKLEAEIIAGAEGIKTQATAFTATATGMPDAIGEAVAKLDGDGYNAGLVVMSPAKFQEIRSERADTGNGQYIAGGWAEPSAPSIWGVPVVTSATLTGDEVLVLDPSQVALLDREGPRFEFGYTDGGFSANIISARLELRAGIAVFSTAAVLSVSVGA